MTLEKVKLEIKAQFKEISAALFKNSISIQEIDKTQRVYAEAGPMFGLNILRYSESNFEYFYTLLNYFLSVIDIVNLKEIEAKLSQIEFKARLTCTIID